jgi:glyoxylase-like metal-dependent hydrolase (beta-lactamase superfamily II)
MPPVTIRPIETSAIKLDVTYAYNVEKEIWKDFNLTDSKSSVDRQNRATMSNYALQVNVPTLVEKESDVTLIGTGVSMRDPIFSKEVLGAKSNQLTKTLQPKLVKRVVLPSLHFLHAGNLVSYNNRGDAEPICPNAEFVIPAGEWEAAMSGHAFHVAAYREVRSDLRLLEKLGARITLVDDAEEEVGPGLTLIRSGGVTPANSSVVISCGSEKIMVSPLLFPTPFHIDPSVQFGFGMHPFLAFEEKTRLLEKAEREGLCLFFPMDPRRRAVYINRDSNGNLVGTECDVLARLNPLIG